MANLLSKAEEILVETPVLERFANLVNQITNGKDSDEVQSAKTLYNFCVSEFPNCLALKLLEVYQSSPNRIVRLGSIYLLSETLAESRSRNFELSLVTLYEIKPLLISCLTMEETQESEIKIFQTIVSCVAYNVMLLDHDGWDELSDCILSLADSEPLKAFHVFIDLPALYDKFIFRFMEKILEQAYKVLLNPKDYGIENWSLALQSAVKMGIQILDTEMRGELRMNILSNLEKSARKLVENGMEPFLVQGLDNLQSFLSRDKMLYNYNETQCLFVLSFMRKISKLGTNIEEAERKIRQFLQEKDKSVVNRFRQPEEMDHVGDDALNIFSPLELLRIVASTDHEEEWFRELAMRRLNDLLSDHTSGKAEIDISVMRQLQPLLISCLKKEGISDSMFNILGQVVNHVANEVFKFKDGKWDGLRDYFASESKRDFKRAVYVFQCLTVPLDNDFFFQFLPEIRTRVETPRDLLVDNNCWVVAFRFAFCAIIQLIGIESHPEYVKDTANLMISSVKELVERGMEAELVRKALEEMESVVKNQLGLYATCEYRFIKGLLWRLRGTQGMNMESKVVLWRINAIVDRGVSTQFKELLWSGEVDWLNTSLWWLGDCIISADTSVRCIV